MKRSVIASDDGPALGCALNKTEEGVGWRARVQFNGLDRLSRAAGSQEYVVIGQEEKIDHEADDFTGVSGPGFLIGRFVEFPDQLFKSAAHFQVGDGVGGAGRLPRISGRA